MYKPTEIFGKPSRDVTKSASSKQLKTKNSVKDIKKNLLGYHIDENKRIQKLNEEQAKTEKTKMEISANNKKRIHYDLPSTTKKFVEVTTGEIIYLTAEGRTYTEDKSGRLVKLSNLDSLAPRSSASLNSQNLQPSKSSSLISLNPSTPIMLSNERSMRGYDILGISESFTNPFANPANMHSPFGMYSPSMNKY